MLSHHHIANGVGNTALEFAKDMVRKICPGRTVRCNKFWQALLEFRNTPNKDGLSPSQRLFKKHTQTKLEAHPQVFHPDLRKQIRNADKKALQLRAKAQQRCEDAKEVGNLDVGDIVQVQHHIRKRWNLIGEIVKVKPYSYLVRSETGRLYWRNKQFIRPYMMMTGGKMSGGLQTAESKRSPRRGIGDEGDK